MTVPLPLFTFGTLMDTELLQLVCEQSIDTLTLTPAWVQDHARRWVLDDHYPVLVPTPGQRTEGLILQGLDACAMERIVFFEGEEFSLKTLVVTQADGSSQTVQFFADNQRKPVSEMEWQLDDWQRSTKQDTLPRVERYMRCFGKMSIAEADAYW